MIFRRIVTPVVLIATMLVQFLPGTALAPRPVAASACDIGQFIADVTVPDGTNFTPGATFTKTWRIKNVGTCTWTTAYSLIFLSGDAMGTPTVTPFSSTVAPGGSIDLTVNLTAPSAAGHFRGYYKLKNASGGIFGVGPVGAWVFFVDINVASTFTTAYDFVTNYCSATWNTAAGTLPCPGTDGSASGYVVQVTTPQLETGAYDSNPGLIVGPQGVSGGYIQGTYPAFTVQAGDRFQSIVNCAFGSSSCYVNFQLRYQIGSGPIQTFWTFKERYEGLFFRVNLDLSSLAGQNVKFILYMADVSGRGVPSGDRAMWSGARIVRGGSGGTPVILTPLPSSACDRAVFIADVTVPDGTVMAGGTPFVKTWRLKNNGTCTWTAGTYALVFAGGDAMGATTTIPLASNVSPGATIDLSVTMTAPSVGGNYTGNWTLRNASGTRFGVGTGGSYPFWVKINVIGAYTTAYDFAAHACDATWTSGAGALPCYGTDLDPLGFVLGKASPSLEDGTTGTPGLLTFPQNVTDGYIAGTFPAFSVQSGDHFQAVIGCEFGATCDVNFRLDYQIGVGPVATYKFGHEVSDSHTTRWDVDLTPLAGQSVKFILRVDANGLPAGDRAIWDPRIARLVLSPTPGPTATTGPGADLSVTITDGASVYAPGATGHIYTVVVTNNGPLNVTGAVFSDALPTQIQDWNVSCVADPGALCTPGPSGTFTGPISDTVNLPAGKKVTYTISSTIASLAKGVLSNSVQITPPDGVPDPIPANNTATDNDNPPYADLQVNISDGVVLYVPSSTTSYTMVVFNAGPVDVTNVIFNDVTTGGVTINTVNCVADPGASCLPAPAPTGSNTTTDTIGIPAGKKVTYTIVTSTPASGTLTNTASVDLTTVPVTDPNPANNSASDTDLPPSSDLMVTLTDNSAIFTAGGTNTFVSVVTNNGPSDVTGGKFTLYKPTQVTTWTITCTPDLGASCAAPTTSSTDYSDTTVNVPAGKKVTYTIVVTIANPTTGPLSLTAYIATPATLPDPVAPNNSATDTDTLSP